jgi:hypothetical protein
MAQTQLKLLIWIRYDQSASARFSMDSNAVCSASRERAKVGVANSGLVFRLQIFAAAGEDLNLPARMSRRTTITHG